MVRKCRIISRKKQGKVLFRMCSSMGSTLVSWVSVIFTIFWSICISFYFCIRWLYRYLWGRILWQIGRNDQQCWSYIWLWYHSNWRWVWWFSCLQGSQALGKDCRCLWFRGSHPHRHQVGSRRNVRERWLYPQKAYAPSRYARRICKRCYWIWLGDIQGESEVWRNSIILCDHLFYSVESLFSVWTGIKWLRPSKVTSEAWIGDIG